MRKRVTRAVVTVGAALVVGGVALGAAAGVVAPGREAVKMFGA
ncbi:hypothetical protein ACFLIM_41815 [Nonomuraea sp. M3C6]|uniref:Uncharacterized protein n=1 Tax=Nonomuraea marmarensis TaxID=3351344 RepID=A0ABW7ARU0_9ACTN